MGMLIMLPDQIPPKITIEFSPNRMDMGSTLEFT